MQLHFQTYGSGFPLLILHGLFGSLDNWQTLSRRFGESFQVFALDLRNHGRSPHADHMDYESMSDDIGEFLQAHNLSQIHLLGHSFGGKVAMTFALCHPNHVAKLVIADISSRSYPPSHRPILDALRALQLSDFQHRVQVDAALADAIPEPAVRQFLLKNLTRDERGAFAWKMNLLALDANYANLIRPVEGEHSFPGPTLFIRGGGSDYVRDTDRPALLKLFLRAQFETLPTAGHWLHADAPEEFFQAVSTFLGRE